MKESVLRDLLAQDIGKLRKGLTLFQKEQFIPNTHGTKSFIDLYAKDEYDRHVLIELKLSAASSRQALHEVSKYVEGVKQYLGARDSEILVIVAATEWRELLVPFSYFAEKLPVAVQGIEICVAEDGTELSCTEKKPLPVERGRLLSPWHTAYLYASREALDEGVRSIESAYRQKGILDYVIVMLERAESGTHGRSPLQYDYAAYTAMQLLEPERYLQILAGDSETLAEAEGLLPELEEHEVSGYLQGCVESMPPVPLHDSMEIGYPAKFCGLSENGGWRRISLLRYGSFQRNRLLSDETICAELRGEDGGGKQRLKQEALLSDPRAAARLKESISQTLGNNPDWRRQLLQAVDEVRVDYPEAAVELWVYHPATGLFTVYYAMTKENGALYLPSYSLVVKNPEGVRLYFGALQESGKPLPWQSILEKYYPGSISALFPAALWEERDSEIVKDMGLRYRTYRVDLNGEEKTFFLWKDERWEPCEACSFLSLFQDYAEHNREFVRKVIAEIGPNVYTVSL